MKCLVVGAGSIGRRHAKNLVQLGVGALVICDPDAERARSLAAEVGATAHTDLDAALAEHPHVAIIASPNHLHIEHALRCARAGTHLFIEKPLSASLEGCAELRDEVRARGLRVLVGCNLRFDDVYQRVRRALDEGALGRVYSAHLHFGYDLAAWRPGIDYRRVYSAHRDQGGGILLDAIHELDLARSWFGEPRRVLSLPRRTGALDADVEDVADLTIEFRSGAVVTVHLDYRDPVYRRHAWVSGDRATIEADFAARTVTLRPRQDADQPLSQRLTYADDRNAMYVRELRHFLAAVEGREPPVADLDDGIAALELALAARDRAPLIEFYPGKTRHVDRDGGPLGKLPIVLQARLGSKRLPGKVLLPAAGRPMLEILVERLRRARRVSQIILATSDAPTDRALVVEAERLGLPCFVGSEDDVLARYLGAVRQYDLPAVVRITGDCPLMDPAVVDAAIERFLALGPDYLSNVRPRSYPDGLDVEVISAAALERTDRECRDPSLREHVTLYIARHPERFEHAALPHPDAARLAPLRWTLDTEADYRFLKAVIEALLPEKPDFDMDDVLDLLARRPELEALLSTPATPPSRTTPTLIGERLVLRPLRAEDADGAYARWMSDPEILRHTEARFGRHTPASLRAFIAEQNANPDVVFLAITEKTEGTPSRHIGNIKLGPINRAHRMGDIGIIIGEKACWGRSYAREAIALLKQYAFDTLGLHKLTASCYGENLGSAKAFEAAGFIREGTRSRHCQVEDGWTDVIQLAAFNPQSP